MTLNETEWLFHVEFLIACLCEIIQRVAYLTELVCIEAQSQFTACLLRLTVHRDCLSRSSNTHAFSQLSLCVLFITTIRLCCQ